MEMFSFRVIFMVSSSSVFCSTASSPSAATRSASAVTMATNSSDLATKSVSERSCTMEAALARPPDGNRTFGCLTVGPLGLAGQALLAQPGDRPVHVAVVLLEGAFGVQHAHAGELAKLLDVLGGEAGHG